MAIRAFSAPGAPTGRGIGTAGPLCCANSVPITSSSKASCIFSGPAQERGRWNRHVGALRGSAPLRILSRRPFSSVAGLPIRHDFVKGGRSPATLGHARSRGEGVLGRRIGATCAGETRGEPPRPRTRRECGAAAGSESVRSGSGAARGGATVASERARFLAGMPPLLRRTLYVLIALPFAGLLLSHAVHWMARAQQRVACAAELDDAASSAAAEIHRSDFPDHFSFGVATAAYQVEGAANEGGRGPSIWDTFTRLPGKILDGSTGDVAVDQYHRYKEDVEIIKSMNVDEYRFSISWSRIIPDGHGPTVNEEGIAYYNRLIDALLSKGIQPFVTLFHWDLPDELQVSYGGWPSRKIVEHFAFYAETCFAAFGDRVKSWLTFNEPLQFSWNGYGAGTHAPGRTSDRNLSPVGNTSTEPYLAGHHVLLAHAAAVDIYRKKFQPTQKGSIGITTDCEWGEPMTDSPEDVEAAERRVLFQLGWFLDPIFFGDYPKIMRGIAGARLPEFSEEERALLHRSVDFIGLNHYTSRWVKNAPRPSDPATSNYYADQSVSTSVERDGVSIGPRAFSIWLYVVPWGVEKLLEWTWNRYKTPLYVTENGMDTRNGQALGEALPSDYAQDAARVRYYKEYLASVLRATRKGVDVRRYFAWSLCDNFEWAMGYTSRFGLYYIDYTTLRRYPKESAKWLTKFLQPKDEKLCQQK